MIDCIGLFFNYLCGSIFEETDYIQPRFRNEVHKLKELAQNRNESYFTQLRRVVEQFRLISNPPEITKLALPGPVFTDFIDFQKLDLLVRSRDEKKLRIACEALLKKKIPEAILEQIVGDVFDLEVLDETKAEKKLANYISLLGSDCTICCETFTKVDFTAKVILRTPCNHFFHQHCYRKWGKNCPTCRLEFNAQANLRRWTAYQERIKTAVEARLKTLEDPHIDLPAISDEELARQLYEADIRALQDRYDQHLADERYARSLGH